MDGRECPGEKEWKEGAVKKLPARR